MKQFLIDDWGILKQIVPGIEPAVLNTIRDLTGEPLTACNGCEDARGYREGTRWLHLVGIDQQVYDQVCNVIQIMSFSFQGEIERAKEHLKNKND